MEEIKDSSFFIPLRNSFKQCMYPHSLATLVYYMQRGLNYTIDIEQEETSCSGRPFF